MDSSAPAAAARPRALIVDDELVVRKVLRHGLEDAGVDVIEASDGVSALRQLVDHVLDLDLLVTDLRMPGLDGATLVRIVRAEGGERELPILVVAASITARDRELLRGLAVDGLVEKGEGPGAAVRKAVALAAAARARRRGWEPRAALARPIAAVPLVRRLA